MLNFAIDAVKKAGLFISDNLEHNFTVEHKGRIDLVTDIDRSAQEILVNEIEKKYPMHSILAEENFRKEKDKDFLWIIDPLDGTTNFVHQLPIFCISLALYHNMRTYIGVCYNPINKEMFFAQAGEGSFRNGQKIYVSQIDSLKDALVATGFPYALERYPKTIDRFNSVLCEVQGIRRLGSAALDLCYVACGRLDAFWEEGLKEWDIAAGIVILQEAGGLVSAFDGSGLKLSQGEILASNGRIHHELIKRM